MKKAFMTYYNITTAWSLPGRALLHTPFSNFLKPSTGSSPAGVWLTAANDAKIVAASLPPIVSVARQDWAWHQLFKEQTCSRQMRCNHVKYWTVDDSPAASCAMEINSRVETHTFKNYL